MTDTLIQDARSFLADLANNNTRDWFMDNKPRYDAQLKFPAKTLLDIVAADLERLSGAPITTKLYRPNRDLRFSKDKTPYHLHLHMSWTVGTTAWFFGIAPGYITAGAGRFTLPGRALTAYRGFAAGPQGAALLAERSRLHAEGFRLSKPELKRTPAPYPADHPNADLLRLKSITAAKDWDSAPDDLPGALSQRFKQLWPLQHILLQIPG